LRKLIARRLLVLVVVLAGVVHASAQQKAPDVSLKDVNGKTVTLSDFRGKVVLLNFWATWCTPCRTEIPDLVKKQRKYQSRGLQIVGITYPAEDVSEVRRFMRELKINYPVLLGSKETKHAFTTSETLPLTVIIDGEGKIRGMIEGIMYPDEFDEKVRSLLASAAGQPENRK
jgi:peroxiredoxin